MIKRIICLVVCLCTLWSLAACSSQPDPQDIISPVYDSTPETATLRVTINGQDLKKTYQKENTIFINLNELIGILEGRIETDVAMEAPYTASLTIGNVTYTISNAQSTLNEGEQAHPLVHNPIYDGKNWYVAIDPIMSLMDLHLLEDAEQEHRYYTYFPSAEDVVAGVRLPILMYHAVSDDMWGINELFVSPSEMEKQLQYLKDNGYTTVTFEDFDRLDEIEKPVMLTFDDGYDDNYTNLFPLLQKFGAKATVFVITGEIGNKYYLTEEQITQMSDSGLVSIQSHTVTHPYLSDLTTEEALEAELVTSKITLARLTGKEPFVLCYPTGNYSNLSLQYTEQHYAFGLLMNGGMYVTGQDNAYLIPRFYISRFTDINTFASKLK